MHAPNERFDLETWLKLLPWRKWDHEDSHGATHVTGPGDLCYNEHLRRMVRPCVEWGRSTPMDIFVWSKGYEGKRTATKVGGLPYWPAGQRWPEDSCGTPLPFLAQFNFSDSRDIVSVPGDLLLVFGQLALGELDPYRLEWQAFTNQPLVSLDVVPTDVIMQPCYSGQVVRVVNYPEARLKDGFQQASVAGKAVTGLHSLFNYNATCIGKAPCFLQSIDRHVVQNPVCALSEVLPNQYIEYPWVNRPEPYTLSDGCRGTLEIGDAGLIYVFEDRDSMYHVHLSSF